MQAVTQVSSENEKSQSENGGKQPSWVRSFFVNEERETVDKKTGNKVVLPCDVCVLPISPDQPGVICGKFY